MYCLSLAFAFWDPYQLELRTILIFCFSMMYSAVCRKLFGIIKLLLEDNVVGCYPIWLWGNRHILKESYLIKI